MSFKNLFTPINVKGMVVRNRIVMLPMTTGYCEHDETVGPKFIDFFAERARGGAGLIIIPFAPMRSGSPVEPGMFEDRFVPGLRKLTSTLSGLGARTAAQLIISYHIEFEKGRPEVVAPSPVLNQILRVMPRELTVDEIKVIVREYGQAARRARQAGFDAVEILVGGGYLLNRFLSPISNKREDEYGGSLENRMRIILEIIAEMRRQAGEDFIFGCRLNVDEQMAGGHTIKDSIGVAQTLEKAGIDIINTYTGWHEAPLPTVAPSLPRGAFAQLTAQIKQNVGIPLIAANRINDPFVAERILSEGKADLVGMGRALLADPELPNKAREGRTDEIVQCLACSNCLSEVVACYRKWGEPVSTFCTVNPLVGREGEDLSGPAEKPLKVFVVGAGPGGLQAAITAAGRGHKVTVFEKEGEPGGQLKAGCLPPFKGEVKDFMKSLMARAEKAGAEIKLKTEAGPELIAAEKPDVLVVATGADALVPPIPGIKGPNVAMAEDVLTGRRQLSGDIVVIGGGMVGLEVAEFLLEYGKAVGKITVMEMLDKMAENVSPTYRPFFLARLKKEGILMKTRATVTEVTGKGVKVSQDGKEVFVEADAVVLAAGYRATPGKTQPFKGAAKEVYFVGDCVQARTIKEAVHEGFEAGRKA